MGVMWVVQGCIASRARVCGMEELGWRAVVRVCELVHKQTWVAFRACVRVLRVCRVG